MASTSYVTTDYFDSNVPVFKPTDIILFRSAITKGITRPARSKTVMAEIKAKNNGGKKEVPIWEKTLLTLEEAASYTGVGIGKLRRMTDDERCEFVLWNGTKRLLKRRKMDEYLEKAYSI